jgi:hypothetical protein
VPVIMAMMGERKREMKEGRNIHVYSFQKEMQLCLRCLSHPSRPFIKGGECQLASELKQGSTGSEMIARKIEINADQDRSCHFEA